MAVNERLPGAVVLSNLRSSRSVSQAALAAELGCTRRMVGQMERGQAKPGRALANRMKVLLGIPQEAWEEELPPARGGEMSDADG